MKFTSVPALLWIALLGSAAIAAQSMNSGTVSGTVKDPSGLVMSGIAVQLRNPVTGYEQSAVTDSDGIFRFNNVPQNNYRLTATAAGFVTTTQPVEVHSTVPVTVNVTMQLASETTTVNVEASGALVETDPSNHTDTDSVTFSKLPIMNPSGGLSDIINYSTGATTADANGFFHPLGDHAQVSYVVDGQPISDQQSKTFSTQLPADAVQSMELITGAPDAQYGDKSSLVVQRHHEIRPWSSRVLRQYRSQLGIVWNLGRERHVWIWTAQVWRTSSPSMVVRTGRFLDTPEFGRSTISATTRLSSTDLTISLPARTSST